MYSPASANVTFVVARPLKAPSPASSFSTSGAALSNVTPPGPRYFDQRSVTGGRGRAIGAFVPLVYFMSSVAHNVNVSGAPSEADFDAAVAMLAIGPCAGLPFCSNRIAGGVLPTAISANGLMA